jgi:hypothetical protein
VTLDSPPQLGGLTRVSFWSDRAQSDVNLTFGERPIWRVHDPDRGAQARSTHSTLTGSATGW